MASFTTDPASDFDFGGYVVSRHSIVLCTELSVVFVNLRPFMPNHLLLSPLSPRKRIADLSQAEFIDLFEVARALTASLASVYGGFTLGIQDGSSAGQTVSHVHLHLVPRSSENGSVGLDATRWDRTREDMWAEAGSLRKTIAATFATCYGEESLRC